MTVKLCGPKLKVFGAVGLNGCVIDREAVTGADGIRSPKGLVTGIVATTELVGDPITDTVLSK